MRSRVGLGVGDMGVLGFCTDAVGAFQKLEVHGQAEGVQSCPIHTRQIKPMHGHKNLIVALVP